MRLAPRGAAVAQTTILGFGSLLSEQSSRLTFPDLENFRLVRVPDYRRLMQHPASIFFQRGIADPQKMNWCSLSAEPCPGSSFVACAFEVVFEGEQRAAYELREEEFHVVSAPYTTLDGSSVEGEGLLCAQWTDEGYREKYGDAVYEERYGKYGVQQIWGWPRDCGATPCPVYLRHCLCANQPVSRIFSSGGDAPRKLIYAQATVSSRPRRAAKLRMIRSSTRRGLSTGRRLSGSSWRHTPRSWPRGRRPSSWGGIVDNKN